MERVTGLPSWLLTQAAAQAHRMVSDGLAEHGARGYHYRVLTSLADTGPASQADLGRRTAIHFSDMVAAINELAAAGYVAKAPDPADRRRNVVAITASGRRHADELGRRLDQVQEELLAPLDAGERAELVRLLGTLLGHHGHQPGRR